MNKKLIANKADLYEEQIVSEELGREFTQKNCMRFNMTSAKTNSTQFKTFLIETLKDYIVTLENKYKNKNSIEIKDSKRKQKKRGNIANILLYNENSN